MISDQLALGNSTFRWGSRTYIIGIVNATPDSFSGDGLIRSGQDWVAAAVALGRQHVRDGAHILDVGGESTRPGSAPVSEAEELNRVLPVVRALVREVAVPVSIDTTRATVAEAALAAGATLVNDIWALRMDPGLGHVVARYHAAIVLMHNRTQPKNAAQEAALGGRSLGTQYVDLISDIARELGERVQAALDAEIVAERIILDPGVGFGKTREQHLELLDRLGELRSLGYPLLVGPSRKGFIGTVLDLPPDDRVEGTAATVAVAITRGADLVRVHDVRQMARVARMTDAIVRRVFSRTI